MKKEDADQLIRCVKECWWRVAIVCFLIFGFTLIAMYGFPSFELDQVAAAWVQAIGAILALAVSIGIFIYDRCRKSREEEAELQCSLESLIGCINDVQAVAANFYKLRVMGVGPVRDKTEFSAIFRAWANTFQNVYLSHPKWSDLGLITAIMEVNVQLGKLLEINDDFIEGRPDIESAKKEMNFIFDALQRSKDQIISLAEKKNMLLGNEFLQPQAEDLQVVRKHLQAMRLEKVRKSSQAALMRGEW